MGAEVLDAAVEGGQCGVAFAPAWGNVIVSATGKESKIVWLDMK